MRCPFRPALRLLAVLVPLQAGGALAQGALPAEPVHELRSPHQHPAKPAGERAKPRQAAPKPPPQG